MATPCDHFDTPDDCASQSGCFWISVGPEPMK
jgi:hypothetical protein